jgi:hypothetical protein
MKHQQRIFLAAGMLFGLSMFGMVLYHDGQRWSGTGIALAFIASILCGFLFFLGTWTFVKFSTWYSGADPVITRLRSKKERAISLLSIPFAAFPLFYALATNIDFVYPLFISSLVPFLLMSRSVSRPQNTKAMLMRAVASIVIATIVCGTTRSLFFADQPRNLHCLIVSFASAVSFTISQLLWVYGNRLRTEAQLG